MDRDEAMEILSVWHPGDDSLTAEVRYQDALTLVENDPELAQWFAERREMDARMREELCAIVPPADLRERILGAIREASILTMPEAAPRRGTSWAWLAAAAAVVLVATGWFLLAPRVGRQSVARFEEKLPGLTRVHHHQFLVADGKMGAVQSWLEKRGQPRLAALPESLLNRGAVECEVTSINGATVSILCFHLDGGKAAHLYVVDRQKLTNPPADNVPQIDESNGLAIASWSAGKQSYFLASLDGKSAVEALL